MTENPENYLFGGLEKAFEENYAAAIEALTQIRNKELLALARDIVRRAQGDSDEVLFQQGLYEQGDTAVIIALLVQSNTIPKIIKKLRL